MLAEIGNKTHLLTVQNLVEGYKGKGSFWLTVIFFLRLALLSTRSEAWVIYWTLLAVCSWNDPGVVGVLLVTVIREERCKNLGSGICTAESQKNSLSFCQTRKGDVQIMQLCRTNGNSAEIIWGGIWKELGLWDKNKMDFAKFDYPY